MAEIGGEMPKPSLKEKVAEAFLPKQAKEKWYRDHKEVVQQYADVNNGLTEDQRADAMKVLEDKATKDATWAVAGHWGAVALGTATLVATGVALKNPLLLEKTLDKIPWGKGKLGTTKVGEKIIRGTWDSHEFLAKIPGKANELAGQARVRAGEAIKTAQAKVGEVFHKNPPPRDYSNVRG